MINKVTEDVYQSFKGAIEERISSPLISSFSISWLIVNFKVVLFIFNSEDLNTKIGWLNFYFNTSSLWSLIYIPLITSAIYIFIYPYIANKIAEFLTNRKLELHEYIVNAEGQQLVTEERLARMQFRHSKEKKELKDRVLELESIIEEMSIKLNSLESVKVDKGTIEVEDPIDNLKAIKTDWVENGLPIDVEVEINKFAQSYGPNLGVSKECLMLVGSLAYLENIGMDYVYEKDLFNFAGYPILLGRDLLKRIVDKKWVATHPFTDGKVRVNLTDVGRVFGIELLKKD
jgi:hypothetical protein